MRKGLAHGTDLKLLLVICLGAGLLEEGEVLLEVLFHKAFGIWGAGLGGDIAGLYSDGILARVVFCLKADISVDGQTTETTDDRPSILLLLHP